MNKIILPKNHINLDSILLAILYKFNRIWLSLLKVKLAKEPRHIKVIWVLIVLELRWWVTQFKLKYSQRKMNSCIDMKNSLREKFLGNYDTMNYILIS